mmetsp:Transcript_72417/g.120705  ORF Transcript_72417/g.120705 Transcript_72417/m.120705 type:complete len:302 (+) Transcript_72417:235-1140(+)
MCATSSTSGKAINLSAGEDTGADTSDSDQNKPSSDQTASHGILETHWGLSLQIDPPLGQTHVLHALDPAEMLKDGTGIGQVWEASEILCEYLVKYPSVVQNVESILELGAGVGVPGLLAARLGANRVILTDYHAVVLSRLTANLARNGLSERCQVASLEWGSCASRSRHSLLLGADLAATRASALLLASTVRAMLADGGVWLYAHHERFAVFRNSDGEIAFEQEDDALAALCDALGSFCDAGPAISCMQLRATISVNECDEERGRRHSLPERTVLMAFGESSALAALPKWNVGGVAPNATE